MVRPMRGPLRALAAGVVSFLPWIAAVALGCVLFARPAFAGSPYLEVPPVDEAKASPAYRYANMTDEQAFAELDRRGIAYEKVGPHGSVRAPIRLSGALHGVDIHGSLPAEQRKDSMFEVLDARLALSIDDFTVILQKHDVVELVHYTMYRPNVPKPGTESEHTHHEKSDGARTKKKSASKSDTKKSGSKKSAPKTDTKKPDTKKPDTKKPDTKKPDTKKSKRAAKKRANLADKETQGAKGSRRDSRPGSTKKKSGPENDALGIHADEGAKKAPKTKKKKAPKTKKRASAPVRRKGPGTKSRSGKRAPAEKPKPKWAPPGTRHPAGLAIDLGYLKKSDGTVLSVAQHFQGKLGDRTCGPNASTEDKPAAGRELMQILCEAKDSAIFTYALTPHFDVAHADHFHLEIKPEVTWFLYH